MVAVFTLHGAVFAALRLPPGRRVRATGTVRRAGGAALAMRAVQVWIAWTFRDKVGSRSAVFF